MDRQISLTSDILETASSHSSHEELRHPKGSCFDDASTRAFSHQSQLECLSKQVHALQGHNSAVMTMLQEQMRIIREGYSSIQATLMAEMRVMVKSRQAESGAKFGTAVEDRFSTLKDDLLEMHKLQAEAEGTSVETASTRSEKSECRADSAHDPQNCCGQRHKIDKVVSDDGKEWAPACPDCLQDDGSTVDLEEVHDRVLAASASLEVQLLGLLSQFSQQPARPNMQPVANENCGVCAEEVQNTSSVLDESRQDATRQSSLVQLGLEGEGRLVEPQEDRKSQSVKSSAPVPPRNPSLLVKLGLLPTDAGTLTRKDAKEQSVLVKLGLLPTDAVVSQNKAAKEVSQLMKPGILPSDTAVSQRKASKEVSRLIKPGLLPCNNDVSQNEPAKELSRLMKLGLLPRDTVVSQRKASKELSRLMKLGLLSTDADVSQNKAAKEVSRLIKPGLLPRDTVVSQNKAAKEVSRLVKLGLLPIDCCGGKDLIELLVKIGTVSERRERVCTELVCLFSF